MDKEYPITFLVRNNFPSISRKSFSSTPRKPNNKTKPNKNLWKFITISTWTQILSNNFWVLSKISPWRRQLLYSLPKSIFPSNIIHDTNIAFMPRSISSSEEDKIWNKAWQAQWAHWWAQWAHVHKPKEGRAHPSCGPLTGRRPRLAHRVSRNLFYKYERLAQQAWEAYSASLRGLLHKERRQDLTTIKRPQHPQKRYAWLIPL